MSRITPFFDKCMSNEGQQVILPNGSKFEFVWSGLICEVKQNIISRQRNGTLHGSFECKKCGCAFQLGDVYYNRKGVNMNRKSSFYCLSCAQLIGFIRRLKT